MEEAVKDGVIAEAEVGGAEVIRGIARVGAEEGGELGGRTVDLGAEDEEEELGGIGAGGVTVDAVAGTGGGLAVPGGGTGRVAEDGVFDGHGWFGWG